MDGKLYRDLGDEDRRVIEIATTGWRVIDNPPVRFRRAAEMQPLPVPVPGGSVETLRPLLNVQSDNDFVLVVAWDDGDGGNGSTRPRQPVAIQWRGRGRRCGRNRPPRSVGRKNTDTGGWRARV